MTVITWDRSGTNEEGLCEFDARRHLQGMAELVAGVFAEELDSSGHGALQEMRFLGRLNPFLGGVLSAALFSDFVLGYVWLETGRVVGNVTFQRADFAGSRFRISNVAVYPQYRRRGIARELMVATLQDIADRGASWAVLQVRVDNPGARTLYESLKFTPVCRDGVWEWQGWPGELDPLPPLPAGIELAPLAPRRWRERLELARAGRPVLAEWAEPLQPTAYRPGALGTLAESVGNLTGTRRVARWGADEDGLLVGAVQAVAPGRDGAPHITFDVRPEWRGRLEPCLLARALSDVAGFVRNSPPANRRPVLVEHSGDDSAGVAALTAAGFRPQRILLTMRRLITPADSARP